MSSETLHEDPGKLGPKVINHHRAIVSLMEEFEAVDWYDQRAKATDDAQLRAIMEHNRDEEKEHAMMVLEWLRRNDPKLDEHMKTYLFTPSRSPKSRRQPPRAAAAKAPAKPRRAIRHRTAAWVSALCDR